MKHTDGCALPKVAGCKANCPVISPYIQGHYHAGCGFCWLNQHHHSDVHAEAIAAYNLGL